MSSHANSQELGRGQQTLQEAFNAQRIYEPISGIHPRVELPDEEHEEWLDGNREVKYVFINSSDAWEVIERDGDLSQVLEPWHLPVILGTEDDEIVNKRSFQDILDLLEVAQPAIYVPDVVYSYDWMDDDIQDLAIEAYVGHVRDLQKAIIERDYDVRLIPTNKGWKHEHFEDYQDLYDDHNYQQLAFYGVQYTGGDAGNAGKTLRGHIRNAITALKIDVFVVGRLAADDLLDFDPRVRGATGLRQWTDACSDGDGLSQDLWSEFQEEREAKLSLNDDQEQSHMNEFVNETEDN